MLYGCAPATSWPLTKNEGVPDTPRRWPSSRFVLTRLAPNDIVYGVVIDDKAKTYQETALKNAKLINDEIAGQNIQIANTICL